MQESIGVILRLSLKTVGLMAVNPVFWLTLWFTYRYYQKYEWDKASAGSLALASSIEGLAAGVLVVCLMTMLGLVVQPGPALIWMGPISMLLSLYRPRFLCMAYGAGVIIGVFWLLKIPVDSTGIFSLVAILHLAEAMLVLLFGGDHTVTIYRRKRKRLVSSSGIYRFWPVPICLLILVGEQENILTMPQWWPLIAGPAGRAEAVWGLLPLTVTLGYSDLSGYPQEVCRRKGQNGLLILLYALLLLGISLLGARYPQAKGGGLLWMVIGHEMIVKGRNRLTRRLTGRKG